jgi:SAM-dependent methyltransferase
MPAETVADPIALGIGDAFGAMLLDAFNEHQSGPGPRYTYDVVEREDGYLLVTPAEHWMEPPRRWPAHVDAGMRRARGRVLDVGCGAGRHALTFLKDGFDVTGLDTSPGAVRVCRRRGVSSMVLGTVHEHAGSDARYDTFLLLGGNVGLLQSREYAPGFLRALAALAAPGAVLLAESVDPALLPAAGGQAEYAEWNRQRGRLAGQTRMRVRYGTLTTPWFDYLYCSPEELGELADGTGWHISETVGSDGPGYLAILDRDGS